MTESRKVGRLLFEWAKKHRFITVNPKNNNANYVCFIHTGLVYIIFKHLVDRYNIYFAYGPSRIDKDTHNTAINFVVIAGMLLQLSVLFFSVLRLGKLTSFFKLLQNQSPGQNFYRGA